MIIGKFLGGVVYLAAMLLTKMDNCAYPNPISLLFSIGNGNCFNVLCTRSNKAHCTAQETLAIIFHDNNSHKAASTGSVVHMHFRRMFLITFVKCAPLIVFIISISRVHTCISGSFQQRGV